MYKRGDIVRVEKIPDIEWFVDRIILDIYNEYDENIHSIHYVLYNGELDYKLEVPEDTLELV